MQFNEVDISEEDPKEVGKQDMNICFLGLKNKSLKEDTLGEIVVSQLNSESVILHH